MCMGVRAEKAKVGVKWDGVNRAASGRVAGDGNGKCGRGLPGSFASLVVASPKSSARACDLVLARFTIRIMRSLPARIFTLACVALFIAGIPRAEDPQASESGSWPFHYPAEKSGTTALLDLRSLN